MASPISMSSDSALWVNLTPLSSQTTGYGAEQSIRTRKASVMGFKTFDSATSLLKSSSCQKESHLYLGNLDLDAMKSKIHSYVESNSMPVCILSCDLVHDKRFKEERALAAHVVINAMNKDKAFSSQCWPCDIVDGI